MTGEIHSISAFCSLGAFPDAGAAVLAGLSGIRGANDFDVFFQGYEEPQPYPIAEAPIVTHGFGALGRFVALLAHAVADLAAASGRGPELAKFPWYLALPDPMDRNVSVDATENDSESDRAARLGAMVTQKAWVVLGWRETPQCAYFGPSRTSFATALESAMAALETGGSRCCVVGALDSLLDRRLLEDFAADNLLRSEDNTYGMTPGEGVVLLILTKPGAEAGSALATVAVGCAEKRVDDPRRGDGRAVAEIIAGLVSRHSPADGGVALITDQNGFLERDLEMGDAWLHLTESRVAERLSSPIVAAAHLGDAGVATGALSSAVVLHALVRRRWREEQGIVVMSDEGRHCAGILLARG